MLPPQLLCLRIYYTYINLYIKSFSLYPFKLQIRYFTIKLSIEWYKYYMHINKYCNKTSDLELIQPKQKRRKLDKRWQAYATLKRGSISPDVSHLERTPLKKGLYSGEPF